MNIVVPLAGRGSRFVERGILTPKPLVSVGGQPMISWALRSLAGIPYSKIIFVALREHERDYNITSLLRSLVSGHAEIILLEEVTEGQLCTVLMARAYLDNDEDVLISSSDTYVISELGLDIANRSTNCHGLISVANMSGDRWSFARVDKSGQVVEVAEKIRISNHASTGLYYFSRGHELISVGDEIIQNRERTRNEYYVIPVYQKFIERGWRIDLSVATEMWDMGTPEALAHFEQTRANQDHGQIAP